ncbi:hypothetical protein SteCoe_22796 [Stentor coeruleus]|uniref:Uncharacterized protein n=1 Tax=Stentor coeruleus TaxID=5963 RepID=A0A1R2BLD3_9CILI|nr:hypothetical protein SteCoe_22796 [Stentor coeruleus]
MTETVPNEIVNKIEQLTMQNAKLKERYEFYKTRFTEISKKTSPTPPPQKTQKNILNDALISSMQHLESLKREKESYLKKQQKIISNSPNELEFQKKQLEQKIKQLKSENSSLRKSQVHNQTFHSSEKTIEISNQITQTQKRIAELESIHTNNQKTIKLLESKLPPEILDQSSATIDNEKLYTKLCKIEKSLQSTLKNNDTKFKQKIKELEAQEQKFNSEKVCLQMKILKTSQQERLLEMTLNQNSENISEHNYTDANFLYKPSIKGLYH